MHLRATGDAPILKQSKFKVSLQFNLMDWGSSYDNSYDTYDCHVASALILYGLGNKSLKTLAQLLFAEVIL